MQYPIGRTQLASVRTKPTLQYLPIKYSDRYVKASRTCVGKGVQVSLTNLPTKNGTHKWCMYLPIKYSDRYVKASRTCVGKGVQVSLTNLPTKNGTHKWSCGIAVLDLVGIFYGMCTDHIVLFCREAGYVREGGVS